MEDKFSIASELRKVCITTTVCTYTYVGSQVFFYDSMFVVMGWSQYIIIVEQLVLLYWSALVPISRSYMQSPILPFSLSIECIRNMESAIIQPIASKSFFEYLQFDLKDKAGLTLYALHSDLRRFTALCDKKNVD